MVILLYVGLLLLLLTTERVFQEWAPKSLASALSTFKPVSSTGSSSSSSKHVSYERALSASTNRFLRYDSSFFFCE